MRISEPFKQKYQASWTQLRCISRESYVKCREESRGVDTTNTNESSTASAHYLSLYLINWRARVPSRIAAKLAATNHRKCEGTR